MTEFWRRGAEMQGLVVEHALNARKATRCGHRALGKILTAPEISGTWQRDLHDVLALVVPDREWRGGVLRSLGATQ